MTITKIRKARAGVPYKTGEGVRERKEIGEVVRERKEIRRRPGKERNREDVRGRKEIGRELMALDACGSFAICHTVAKYIFRIILSHYFPVAFKLFLKNKY